MAFFSNSGSRADSGGYNLNEKAEDEGAYESVRDGDVDLSSRQWNLNEKAEDAYHSEPEQYEAGQPSLYSSENTSGQHAQRGGRSSGGPWGTNFLKDSRSKQPAEVLSNSGRGMVAASSRDDMDDSGEDDELNRANGDMPAEEMLSDDYYEQDGEEQIESLHRGRTKQSSCSTSGGAAKSASRQKKTTSKYNAYADDDDEYNDENDADDDADEDDPDDVDFEPDSETDKAADKVFY